MIVKNTGRKPRFSTRPSGLTLGLLRCLDIPSLQPRFLMVSCGGPLGSPTGWCPVFPYNSLTYYTSSLGRWWPMVRFRTLVTGVGMYRTDTAGDVLFGSRAGKSAWHFPHRNRGIAGPIPVRTNLSGYLPDPLPEASC